MRIGADAVAPIWRVLRNQHQAAVLTRTCRTAFGICRWSLIMNVVIGEGFPLQT